MELLSKAVDPAHFASIVKASDQAGANLVDHTPHLSSHPPSIQPAVNAYHDQVVNSEQKVGKAGKAGLGDGITKKVVFKARANSEDHKFMVKPYHERVISRVKSWMKYPIQGWAEMAHQSLYHAAGIGHLHQKVHVTEHDMGKEHEKEPALVVHISPGHVATADGGGIKFDQKKNGDDLRKIALMDFLTNNHDRHGGNLMINQQSGAPLAIDHGRSFQYVATKEEINRKRNAGFGFGNSNSSPHYGGDTFGAYVTGSTINNLDPIKYQGIGGSTGNNRHDHELQVLRNYASTFDWWGEKSEAVRNEFSKHIEQIRDPEVKEHVQRNFNARADWLDERSRLGLENYNTDWFKDEAPMYKPGQISDEEKENPEFMERHYARKAAAHEAKKKARQAKKKIEAWNDARPNFPNHLWQLSNEERLAHPDWQSYSKSHETWMAQKPEGA